MLRRAFPNPWRKTTITWSGPPLLALVILCALGSFTTAAAADIVIDASDIPASAIHGAWSAANDPTSPNGIKLATPATGISTTSAPFSSPTDYVDVTFTADAGVPFSFWIRLEALNNSKASDSVWVQFSDALVNGSPIYPMNTTSGLLVNLATDSSGSSDVNWGWVNGCYWLAQPATVMFATSGTHTVRLQVREAGVEFDQIVLSSGTYLNTAPGVRTNDTTIVAESAGAPPSSTSTPTGSVGAPLAYGGVAPNLPGDISAANFDTGGEGVSYYDTTPGNTGGAYRSTDVDLEASSIGGYDVGWIAASEWLNYTVNVTSAGAYTAQIRVASPSAGGSLHIGFNTASNVWIFSADPGHRQLQQDVDDGERPGDAGRRSPADETMLLRHVRASPAPARRQCCRGRLVAPSRRASAATAPTAPTAPVGGRHIDHCRPVEHRGGRRLGRPRAGDDGLRRGDEPDAADCRHRGGAPVAR